MEYLNDKSVVQLGDTNFEKISPLELKNRLIQMADENIKKMAYVLLNASRGNPNWIANNAREAFFTLGQFAIEESRHPFYLEEGLSGLPKKAGIAQRFESFLKKNEEKPGIEFLKNFYKYMLLEHAADPDELVHEWVEGIIGCQYPSHNRILKYTEMIVRDYLVAELCNGKYPKDNMDLFATEGSTAAICYVFDSLMNNFLLQKGDSIALMTPIFTPLIEIPELARYDFDVLNINASCTDELGHHTWQYKVEDINKLRDHRYKAVVLLNPSNPPSYATNKEGMEALKDVIERWNPNLMIITDDVYASFVPGFKSFLSTIPNNTICIYSFSKFFGATGWRLGVVALDKVNIFDKLIAHLPRKRKGELEKRYSSLTMKVDEMKFIDRMVADSRQVALYHTAGLSTPQQIQMGLFAASSILDKDKKYKKRVLKLIQDRLTALWKNAGFTLSEDPLRAGYYSEIDMLEWAKKTFGKDFVTYLKKNFNPLDIVFRLARNTGLVVLNGGGFDGPEWSIRVSLANLNEADYEKIGKYIRNLLNEYAEIWKESLEEEKKKG